MTAHIAKPLVSLRYSIRRLSNGWSVFDNREMNFVERGLTYDEAHSVAAYWDSVDEAEASVLDEAEDPRESRSDFQHQAAMEGAA